MMSLCSKAMLQIVNLPRPVIAACPGRRDAAGCQLVASCDLAGRLHGAKFATPAWTSGCFARPPMVALSRNIARKHAMEMLLTATPLRQTTPTAWG
jgi:enoyl-CoA hydratase/carnithine racemase